MAVLHNLGWILVSMSVVYFLFKMFMVFDMERDPGSGGGAPVFDGVIFPPICGTFGVSFIRTSPHQNWGFPAYALLWLLLTMAAILIFALADRVGAFCRKRK
jgi:hypothetical protein